MKIKIFLIFAFCNTLPLTLFSQTIYFPKHHYKDSISLEKYMPDLANKVAELYQEVDSSTYYGTIFRYQMVAKDYLGALKSISAFRKIDYPLDTNYAKGIAAQFESYILTKIEQEKTFVNFNSQYENILKAMLKGLNDKAVYSFSNYFNNNIAETRANLYKAIGSIDTSKDNIGFDLAKKICRSYNSYIVYSQIISIGKPIFNKLSGNQLIIEDSVLIKTRDGATLSARIARKKNQVGKLPCILMFNIYANVSDRQIAIDAALSGYVGIVVNPRGKYLSNDTFVPYEDDSKDVYDAIDWISKQTWCDGKVGMYGGSHLGFSQWAAAKSLHPALKTIVPQVPVVPGTESVYRGSIAATSNLSTIYFHTSSRFVPNIEFRQSKHWDSLHRNWYLKGLPFKSLDSLEGRPNAIFQKWIKHPSFDAYWQSMIPYKQEYAKIKIPVLTITGHFDGNLRGSFYYFHEHYKYNPKANHYIVFGPYDHFGAQGTPKDNEDFKMDSVAKINIEQLVYDWFDFVLKGKPKPAFLKDKINYQVMGKNIWKHSSKMKNISNDTLKFYLSNDSLNGNYNLSKVKQKNIGYVPLSIDFKDRTDTSESYYNIKGFIDTVLGKHNSVMFVSKPLENNLEVTGEFLLQLNAEINKRDMDIDANLFEKLADGRYFWISESTNRASYLKNISKRNLLTPNSIEKLPKIKGRFMSKIINKGSQLVILLGVPKDKAREINYGTGKPVAEESIKDAGEPLQIKWYNDSYIKIPVWRDKMLRPAQH
jgi:uncharacterized protein